MENRIKMDDLGVPLFLETPITVGDFQVPAVNFLGCKHFIKNHRKLLINCHRPTDG